MDGYVGDVRCLAVHACHESVPVTLASPTFPEILEPKNAAEHDYAAELSVLANKRQGDWLTALRVVPNLQRVLVRRRSHNETGGRT